MRFPVKILVAVSFLLMSACSQVPQQGSSLLHYETKLQASEHWKAISYSVAREVQTQLDFISTHDTASRQDAQLEMGGEFGYIEPPGNENNLTKLQLASPLDNMTLPIGNLGPVRISEADQSVFGKSLRTFLKTDFFKNNIAVSSSEKSPYSLDWEIIINKHKAERYNCNPGLVVGLLGLAKEAILGGNDLQFFKPHNEVVVTFILKDTNYILSRSSAVYYINDKDVSHYKTIHVAAIADSETISNNFIVVGKN
ncbi:MAG: hypothetical protein MUO63_00775 [Desulfobulbaceae bacterium]|nr:hypothetical protein [Desulfobulbaceae bacterium]